MQEQEAKKEKMVDIDTSGPDTEVNLPEEKNVPVQEDKREAPVDTVEEKDTGSAEDKTFENEREIKLEKDDQEEKVDSNKKDELENYGKDVQRRIAKLTGKWREAQRQRDEALEFAKAQIKEKEALSKKYTSLETESVKDRQTKIQSLLEAQKAKLAQAREASDVSAEVDIQKEISKLGYEEARLKELSYAAEQNAAAKEDKVPSFESPAASNREIDPKAEAWASNNRWFGTDNAMTYTAFDLHKTLVDQEGYDPKSDDYYVELDRRIRLEFPHKFDTNDTNNKGSTTKPTQTVASAKRSVKSSRKTVSLTPSQVAIAKKLGVSLEDYAKQLKIMKEV